VVLEISNQLLLLGVYRDRRLACGDRCLHRRIDMLKLSIAVRVVTPLPRLAIGLATVVQLPQQLADHTLADFEALRSQCLHQVALAAADPAQWRGGIAANRVLDQPLQRGRQLGLLRHRALAPSTRPAQSRAQLVAGRPQFLHPAVDRAAGQTSCYRRSRDTAMALRQRFVGRE
jgi:hypothetical protein